MEDMGQVKTKILEDKSINGYIGMAIFAFLSAITFLNIKRSNKKRKLIINIGIGIGSIIAFYLLYLQFFVLHAFCTYCLIIDFGLLVALGIIILFKG